MSLLYKIPLVLEPQIEGGFIVTCPFLPELITEGDTAQEAIFNANEALLEVVETYKDTKCRLPSALQPSQADAPIWVETVLTVP
ncbi:MAG: type II toxin-antitoxin system HicB family antitoxin [Chloroflexota bacterium]|jgi:antitoxin HicB